MLTTIPLLAHLQRLIHRARLSPWLCPLCGEPGAIRGGPCPWCQRAMARWQHGCPYCAEPLPVDAPCPRCLRRRPPLTQTRAVWSYTPPIDALITGFKYHQQPHYATFLATLAQHYFATGERPDALVPIPLHRQRLHQRGYNQAALIADALGTFLNLAVTPLLIRATDTPAQAGLTAAQRRRNLRRAFQVAENSVVRGRHLVLIDDVMTTGSTLFAAARVLREAGARRIDAWVLARTPAHRGISV